MFVALLGAAALAGLLYAAFIVAIPFAARYLAKSPRPLLPSRSGHGPEALVLGTSSLLAWYVPLAGIVIAATAAILGYLSLKTPGRELGIAGGVVALIGFLLSLAAFVFSLAFGLGGIVAAPAPP